MPIGGSPWLREARSPAGVDLADAGLRLGVADEDLAVVEVDVGDVERGDLGCAKPSAAQHRDERAPSVIWRPLGGHGGTAVDVDGGRGRDAQLVSDLAPGALVDIAQREDAQRASVAVRLGVRVDVAGRFDQRFEFVGLEDPALLATRPESLHAGRRVAGEPAALDGVSEDDLEEPEELVD